MSGPASAPAGWYPDPSGQARQRYWDGRQWTMHCAPALPTGYPPPRGPTAQHSGSLSALGLAMAILMPLIGFVLGLVLLGRREDREGMVVVMISIAAFVLYVALLRHAS
jgi:Protein of unknown function (DUF2510)